MALAEVSYPTFSESDLQWIQEIRKMHDKLFYKVVDPHFTFIFPTENIDLGSFINHITSVSERFYLFPLICRCVTVI